MSNAGIRTALEGATAYLTEHPDEARYTDTEARAVLSDGLAVTVSGPDGVGVATDMAKSVGGGASGPSPGWLLRAAQASCLATFVAMRAAQQGVDLGRIEVIVDSESDDRGTLGLDDSLPAGPLSTRARVRVERDTTQAADIVRWAEAHCPVQDAIRRAVPSTVELSAG